MKLFIQTPAPNYTLSKEFYQMIAFTTIYSDDKITIVSDGTIEVVINSDRAARLGLVAYLDNYTDKVEGYQAKYPMHAIEGGYMTADPNGVRLYLRPLTDLPKLSDSVKSSILGRNFGFGMETVDMEESLNFWNLLGFDIPASEDRSYVTLKSPLMPTLTLFSPGICPHSFYNPSLTYFNGKEDNPKIIKKLKRIGIQPKEEITAFSPKGEVDNIIINDPGGLHYFIFND